MSEVSRKQQSELVRNLKSFAFEESESFRDGQVAGIHLVKSFLFNDDALLRTGQYMRSVFQLDATRLPRTGKPEYEFNLSATTERSIDALPNFVLDELELEEEDDEDFDEDLTESMTMTFEIDTLDPDTITTQLKYTVDYMGNPIYESDSEEFPWEFGQSTTIPLEESLEGSDQHFISQPIEHEKMSNVERALTDFAFQQIIDPYKSEQPNLLIDYDDAAARMIRIIAQLRDGKLS